MYYGTTHDARGSLIRHSTQCNMVGFCHKAPGLDLDIFKGPLQGPWLFLLESLRTLDR